jgi:octaprenyl-diphosphate synthase
MGVVVPFGERGDGRASLKPLLKVVAADMEKINETILWHARSHVDLIPKLAAHLINSGGKRLRPMVTLAAARMFDYAGELHLPLAIAVEFMHTATLLHDDVVDESDVRRGRKAARLIWGNQATVLVGDYLLSQTFKMLVDTGLMDALRIMSHAAATIAEGEVMQLQAQHDVSTTEDRYMEIINAKTAALFAAAAQLGAVVAERPAEECAALESFGRNLGIAFQLVDDALDYAGEQDKLGKAVGDDFREGKITLPVVLSYRRGTEKERRFWKRVMEEGDQREGDLEQALEIMARHHAIEDTIERARHYGAIARDAMAFFPASEPRDALIEAVDFCIARVS